MTKWLLRFFCLFTADICGSSECVFCAHCVWMLFLFIVDDNCVNRWLFFCRQLSLLLAVLCANEIAQSKIRLLFFAVVLFNLQSIILIHGTTFSQIFNHVSHVMNHGSQDLCCIVYNWCFSAIIIIKILQIMRSNDDFFYDWSNCSVTKCDANETQISIHNFSVNKIVAMVMRRQVNTKQNDKYH